MHYPDWLRTERVMSRAEWDGREEAPEQLAVRLLAHLEALDAALGDTASWTDNDGGEQLDLADPDRLRSFVAAHVDRDDDGVAWPRRGYWFSLVRSGQNGSVSFRYRVGASIRGRRLPANAVSARITGPIRGDVRKAMSSEYVSAVLRATVTAWDPESAAVYDSNGIDALEDVSKFAPVMGQLTWVSQRLGDVETATSGVQTEPGDGGWYLTADAGFDSRSAVSEVRSTLEANGLMQIPRAAA